MPQKFSKGDTVVLKSGGPLMTIQQYKKEFDPNGRNVESDEEVECIWFENNERKTGSFHQDTLIKEEIE